MAQGKTTKTNYCEDCAKKVPMGNGKTLADAMAEAQAKVQKPPER